MCGVLPEPDMIAAARTLATEITITGQMSPANLFEIFHSSHKALCQDFNLFDAVDTVFNICEFMNVFATAC